MKMLLLKNQQVQCLFVKENVFIFFNYCRVVTTKYNFFLFKRYISQKSISGRPARRGWILRKQIFFFMLHKSLNLQILAEDI